jgi:hypothetical protein
MVHSPKLDTPGLNVIAVELSGYGGPRVSIDGFLGLGPDGKNFKKYVSEKVEALQQR